MSLSMISSYGPGLADVSAMSHYGGFRLAFYHARRATYLDNVLGRDTYLLKQIHCTTTTSTQGTLQ